MSSTNVSRPIMIEDVAACHQLSLPAPWSIQTEDWKMMIELGQGLVIEKNEKVVATALWWLYGEKHAVLGMFIVDPEWQNQGIGTLLMKDRLAHLDERNLLLYATEAGQRVDKKFGFIATASMRVYLGKVADGTAPVLRKGQQLRPLMSKDDLEILFKLDRQATGLPRKELLEALLKRGEAVFLEQDGEPVGFSIFYPFGDGQTVGPVVALKAEDACILIQYWLHSKSTCLLRINLPDYAGLDDWLRKQGLAQASLCTTMVRGDKPTPSGPTRLFALTNL